MRQEKSQKDYVEEAEEDLRFKKHFDNYITLEKAYTDKKELAYFGMPYYNEQKAVLEFSLNRFEDYLIKQKINLPRVDLVIKCQNVLKAKKNHGKYGTKSCVSWRILNYKVEKEDLILEGVYQEVKDE